MKINCKKCKKEVIKLNFTEEQKLDIYVLMQNDLRIFAEKKLIDDFKLSQNEAKVIVKHFNNRNGKCTECEFDKLESEKVECSNCGAFNYNLNEPIFNIEFCSNLEWNLDFQNTENKNVENFWCDGVDHLPKDSKSLLYKNIEKNKQIITKTYIGNTGQDIYEMKIKFGKLSIENYKNQKSLIECIPKNNENPNWIKINLENKKIEVELK
jgi:hypothetical protein